MNVNDAFPSNYLKSSDLQGRAIRVKIREVAYETIGNSGDNKIVLHFQGKNKGMICNRTNCMTITEMWGPETDNWIGGELELFSTKVPFQGKLTDAIRVRPIATNAAKRGKEAPPPPPADDGYRGDDEGFSDEVPF